MPAQVMRPLTASEPLNTNAQYESATIMAERFVMVTSIVTCMLWGRPRATSDTNLDLGVLPLLLRNQTLRLVPLPLAPVLGTAQL